MQNKSVELRFAYLLEGCGYLRLNKRPITPHSTDMEFGRLYTKAQCVHYNIPIERSVSFVILNLQKIATFSRKDNAKTLSLLCLPSRRIASANLVNFTNSAKNLSLGNGLLAM